MPFKVAGEDYGLLGLPVQLQGPTENWIKGHNKLRGPITFLVRATKPMDNKSIPDL